MSLMACVRARWVAGGWGPAAAGLLGVVAGRHHNCQQGTFGCAFPWAYSLSGCSRLPIWCQHTACVCATKPRPAPPPAPDRYTTSYTVALATAASRGITAIAINVGMEIYMRR